MLLVLLLAPGLAARQGAVPSSAPSSTGQAIAGGCWSGDDRATPLASGSAASIPQWRRPPMLVIDPARHYAATITTSKGVVVVALDPVAAPVAVNNFVCLAEAGFFDHTTFHRIVANFVIAGGDPTGTGVGGPGYTFDDEPVTRAYTKGTVAMANAGPNTNGSQFFICLGDINLPPNDTIFGQVTPASMDVVDAIGQTPTRVNSIGEKSEPIEPVTIESVSISVTKSAAPSPVATSTSCAHDNSNWGFCGLPGYQTRVANIFRTEAGVSPASYLVIGVARFDSPAFAELDQQSGWSDQMLVTVFAPARSVRQVSVPPIADDDLVYAGPADTVNSLGTPIAQSGWTGALMLVTARQGPLIWYGFLLSDTLEGASQLAEIMRTAVARHPDVAGALGEKLPTLADLPGGWMLVSANDQGEYS